MKIESEKLLERKLAKEIKKLGGWLIKLPAIHVSGLPDRLGLLPGGIVFFAEIKTTGEEVKRIQLFIHSKIRKLGFKVYIIESTKDINNLITIYERE